MMRTCVFTDEQLEEAFRRAKPLDKFHVLPKYLNGNPKSEQNRVYKAASAAKRQITMRVFRRGWKATVIE